MKPTLYLMVGLPCSGKTTRAKEMEREIPALRLTPDEWHVQLFGHDTLEPDHDIRHDRIEHLLWGIARRSLELGTNVILDFGFWAVEERNAFRDRAKVAGARSEIVFMDVEKSELLRRVQARNRKLSEAIAYIPKEPMLKWMESFERPLPDELVARD